MALFSSNSELFRDRPGESGEAARHQRRPAAGGTHGLYQFASAGCQRDAPGDDPVDDRRVEPPQQGDPRAQRRLEGDLAVHGTGGNRGDMCLEPHLIGQFVDALLVDHGRIHVGYEDFFPASGIFVYHHVNRF